MTDEQVRRERRCYICLRQIPEREGHYQARLDAWLCLGPCSDVAQGASRNYDTSFRGRRRPLGEWKRTLRAMRPRGPA